MTTYGAYDHGKYSEPYPTDNRYGSATPAPASTGMAPPTNGGWAAAALLFFWPLAFVAFSRALSVPMLWAQGREREAWDASATVARLGKIAIVMGVAVAAVIVAINLAFFAAVASNSTPSEKVQRPTFSAPSFGVGG